MVKAGYWGNKGNKGKWGEFITRRFPSFLLFLAFLSACSTPNPTPPPNFGGFEPETQKLIDNAERVAFIVPFSHWDTDWHETFAVYGRRTNANIQAAINMAQAEPRFRYALEQVAFVKHFWESFPNQREALRALVHNGQFTFAWAGITQPETSLAAPAVQMRNWQIGAQWITETFGAQYVPHTAWQSDAFGNSAAFPQFLQAVDVPYLFIGRWQHRCDPDHQDCVPLPLHFYWKSPATEARVLTAYVFYSDAWGDIFRAGDDETKQLEAIQAYVAKQFERTTSRYAFIPMGFDFLSPLPQLMRLVDANNASAATKFVVSDPETAFKYLATQDLPEFEVDLNPIWQGFYGSRPYARIADKESEYYLTANAKFGGDSSAWYTATFSAHYDNIAAVSFDTVWETAQKPRFEQTVLTAAQDLAHTLAGHAAQTNSNVLIFNPSAWARSEVVEVWDENVLAGWPHQPLSGGGAAIRVEAVPGVGWSEISTASEVPPVTVSQTASGITLSNNLVTVEMDAARGGTFSILQAANSQNVLSGPADDLTYWADTGDIYGARFGEMVARASQTPAQLTVLEEGPLLTRVQAAFTLGGQPVTKTVTLRAASPYVEVALTLKALPETSAVVHIPTNLQTQQRTDDVGFGPMTHEFDAQPITPGDITYRRKIFYPTMYWTNVSDANAGLTLMTHGLQGVGGVNELSLLLVRWVTDKDGEGLTDPDYHTLHYAYLPHGAEAPGWSTVAQRAYEFNQPLIPVWRAGQAFAVQLPFQAELFSVTNPPQPAALPVLRISANEILADVLPINGQLHAFTLNYDSSLAAGRWLTPLTPNP
ncbi:MAG: hypothetical protein JNL09_08990 [Anaerolineales bacterium]|nr:hypothetical protein [Anaerolineales bacterium]